MRVAISQPEHFPYLGFFQKMCACDLFVLLDDVQFSGPRSFQNRNRYLNCNGEYKWFTAPVKNGSYYQIINMVEVSDDDKWRIKLQRRLMQDLHFDCFKEIYGFKKLVDINIAAINYCRDVFKIDIPVIRSSDLNVAGTKVDRIYNICKALGADVYVAGLGSREYMMSSDFREIEVQYFYPKLSNYESAIVHACSADEKLLSLLETIKKNPALFCKGE